ncbi:hypothetical protein CDCA_CDCA18G4616 [Cyanidium caldarium]|uniref:Transcription initiation factor IIE subunit alpha N-terminal domain-containing protein n=1 Tax=Cyanidium caldarium TaxID=2771 RepID=A0AAV9J2F5_CYACA|nr:hypothetical protein CDCA_CDCA18G4616 [Cyanidium caldarium]
MTATSTSASRTGKRAVRERRVFHFDNSRYAPVPPEYERLVRMVVRAFMADAAVVVLEMVLRLRYCTDSLLSPILQAPPKVIRRVLWRLRDAGLVRCESRSLRRVYPSRNPAVPPLVRYRRLLYWRVDYARTLDTTLYKLQRMREHVEEQLGRVQAGEGDDDDDDAAAGAYQCERCGAHYAALDVPSLTDFGTGALRCRRLVQRGVRCGGAVHEVNSLDEAMRWRALRQELETTLRPLAEAAAACRRLELPRHPLDGMSEQQVGALMADHDARGEQAQRHAERATDEAAAAEAFVGPHELAVEVEVGEGNAVPAEERPVKEGAEEGASQRAHPTWFRDQEVSPPGIEASSTAVSTEPSPTASSADEADTDEYADVEFEEAGSDTCEAPSDAEWSPADRDTEAVPDACRVAGELYPLQQVTAEHLQRMSSEEYQAYYRLLERTRAELGSAPDS